MMVGDCEEDDEDDATADRGWSSRRIASCGKKGVLWSRCFPSMWIVIPKENRHHQSRQRERLLVFLVASYSFILFDFERFSSLWLLATIVCLPSLYSVLFENLGIIAGVFNDCSETFTTRFDWLIDWWVRDFCQFLRSAARMFVRLVFLCGSFSFLKVKLLHRLLGRCRDRKVDR